MHQVAHREAGAKSRAQSMFVHACVREHALVYMLMLMESHLLSLKNPSRGLAS